MTQKSSRTEQQTGGQLIPNPAKKFLTVKNKYSTEEIITGKGKRTEVKVFDSLYFEYSEKNGEEWEKKTIELPIEFAILNGDWVNFKGWNETEKCLYWSNEVKNPDSIISIRNKEGVVYEFTLNQMWGRTTGSKVKDEKQSKEVKAKLKELNVKQHSSIYIVLRDTNEIINLQLKGSNLSGSQKPENQPSGWWNISKKYKPGNNLYKYWFQINDFIEETGEMGNYGILNFTQGELINEKDGVELDTLFDELESYHTYYNSKPELASTAVGITVSDDVDPEDI